MPTQLRLPFDEAGEYGSIEWMERVRDRVMNAPIRRVPDVLYVGDPTVAAIYHQRLRGR